MKLLACAVGLAMSLSLAACGDSEESTSTESKSTESESKGNESTENKSETETSTDDEGFDSAVRDKLNDTLDADEEMESLTQELKTAGWDLVDVSFSDDGAEIDIELDIDNSEEGNKIQESFEADKEGYKEQFTNTDAVEIREKVRAITDRIIEDYEAETGEDLDFSATSIQLSDQNDKVIHFVED